MPAPIDDAFRALERTADKHLDPHGNRQRRKWLSNVEADADGCWIWQGLTTGLLNGRRYPQFTIKDRTLSAFTYLCKLWAPDLLVTLPPQSRRKLCGKDRCVRPACVTLHGPVPTGRQPAALKKWTNADLYELRVVHRMTYPDMARKLGVPVAALQQACRLRGYNYTAYPPHTDPRVLAIYDMWTAGEKEADIYRALGVGRWKVHHHRLQFIAGYVPHERRNREQE